MQISFNTMLNTNKTQNVSTNKTNPVANVSSNSATQRKSFDQILISTTNTAQQPQSQSMGKVDSAKKEIVSEATTPKTQEFLNNLKSEIESGNYDVNVHQLAKNLAVLGDF